MNKQQKIELLENELHTLENRILDLLKELQRKDNIIKDIKEYVNYLVIFNQTINGKFSETQWGQDILGLIEESVFIKTLKKSAEEPDEVINYNEQLKKIASEYREQMIIKDNIINNITKYVRTFKTDEITDRELCILNDILLITEEKENIVARLKENK